MATPRDRQPATPVSVPGARVTLSTSSVYPDGPEVAFRLASELGYDGVEVMVWTDPVSQRADPLLGLSEKYALPVLSVHAPTLLWTQRVWGANPWVKVDRSVELAQQVGAAAVVVHPPFRWQRTYAAGFVEGVAAREERTGMPIAVENMFPWRAQGRAVQAYLPHWNPLGLPYRNVTLDLSHTATSRSDALGLADALGDRLSHVHLADGMGSPRDEHLVPGRGTQPCAEVLELLAGRGYQGSVVVEVSTRGGDAEQREAGLAEALAFARLHLAVAAG